MEWATNNKEMVKLLQDVFVGVNPLAIAIHRAYAEGILVTNSFDNKELSIEKRRFHFTTAKNLLDEGADINQCFVGIRALDSKLYGWTHVPLTLAEQIGEGFFGTVYKGMKGKVPVAWKKAQGDSESILRLISELKVLK